jgi:hypothetical protein
VINADKISRSHSNYHTIEATKPLLTFKIVCYQYLVKVYIISTSLKYKCYISGNTILLRSTFSAQHFFDDCRQHNVTMIQYIGELCRYLLALPEASIYHSHPWLWRSCTYIKNNNNVFFFFFFFFFIIFVIVTYIIPPLRISILPLSTIFLADLGFPTVCYFVGFHFKPAYFHKLYF